MGWRKRAKSAGAGLVALAACAWLASRASKNGPLWIAAGTILIIALLWVVLGGK